MKMQQVVSGLEASLGIESAPTQLQSAIEALLTDSGMTRIEASEKAHSLKDRVSRAIAEREIALTTAGHCPILRLIGTTEDIVIGFSRALPGELPEVAALRMQRLHVAEIHQRLRNLTFNEFEKFGARFLRELGARVGRVTPQSNDQGIDFYGEFSFAQLHDHPGPFLVLAKDVRLLFAGQAKHYPNRSIGPGTIRELIGAMTLARTKTHSTDGVDIFSELAIRPFSPVIALLFSTGEFTSGAIRLADAAGVVVKTGLQLAVFLADRGVGIFEEDGANGFSEQAFVAWLTEP